MDGIVKVDPQKLISTADEFSTTGNQLKNLTSEMMNKVTSLSSAWEGDASKAYIDRFRELQDDMDRMFSMIQEHAKDLDEMAQKYILAENENIEMGNSLSGNAIQ